MNYPNYNKEKALTREFLLSRGACCGNNCLNCPYIPKHKKGSKEIDNGTRNREIPTSL